MCRKLLATRPGHDADASREPARSYARDQPNMGSTSSGTATTRTTTTESVARPTSSRRTDYALGSLPALGHHNRLSDSYPALVHFQTVL